jgi:hypothetical protein
MNGIFMAESFIEIRKKHGVLYYLCAMSRIKQEMNPITGLL